MKSVPLKNYILLFVYILLTVVFVFYVRSWYITNKEYYSRNSVIKDVTREINVDEISNYVLENPKFMLYVSSGGNSEIKEFEGNFKRLIRKFDISDDILYLNTDEVDIDYLNSSLKRFSSSDKVESLIVESKATLFVFSDGKIIGVLNNMDSFSEKHIKSFIKKWGFING